MGKTVLEVKGITKEFPGVKALKGVDFNVKLGEVHALCGENGAGKSTLMHILAGVYKANSGEIFLDGNAVQINNQKNANDLGISIVYQERSLVNGMSVAENIFAGRQPVRFFSFIDFKSLYSKAQILIDDLQLNVSPRVLVDNLSPASLQMVEIAKALSINPKVLILDEPTATITEKEVEILFNLLRRLKEKGLAIIYISHRLEEIFQIADRVTVFKDGQYIETEDVKVINKNWIINKMVGRDLVLKKHKHNISGEVVLECKDLTGKRFRNISFYLKKGEILSFAGLAGAGRTEVMKAIFGADPLYKGKIMIKGRKVSIKSCMDAIDNSIGYLPEDRKAVGVFLEMSVSANIVSASLDKVKTGINMDYKKVKRYSEDFCSKLRIVTPSIMQKAVNLSGGNQQKVVMAKWLMVMPDILIVDEPTRGIDVGAKSEIYEFLRQLSDEGISIIVVSSELPEVLAISDRIYVMHEGTIVAEISGDKATEETIMKYASGIIE